MLKLNIGFNRKIGEANFGSRGASVNLEIEVESGVVREPDKLQAKIDYLFKLAKASVDAQLNGSSPPQQTQPAANNNGNNGMARTPMPTRARPTATAMATGTHAQRQRQRQRQWQRPPCHGEAAQLRQPAGQRHPRPWRPPAGIAHRPHVRQAVGRSDQPGCQQPDRHVESHQGRTRVAGCGIERRNGRMSTLLLEKQTASERAC